MYCPSCGNENHAQASACRICGIGLAGRCRQCGGNLSAGARFCSACGSSVEPTQTASDAGPPALVPTSGGRKLVTILFADFAGYTAFTEKRDPEDVQDYLTGLWARLDKIIADHGGIIEKHIGDALMAIFGSLQAREEDPVEAVRAALELQECALRSQATERSSPLQLRVGIHTGWVVLGPAAASGERLATGDTVNLASRIEHSAPVGGVLVSHETYRQVYGFFDVQTLPPLSVRGKSEPIQTYLVLRARPRSLARTLRGIEGVETELVGRQQELDRLCSTFRRALEQRELMVLTVTAEPGLGKSRLLHEFRKWLEVLPQEVPFFYGRAVAEWSGLPFALIRDVFAARFEIQESDSAQVAREKFANGFEDMLQPVGDPFLTADRAQPTPAYIGQLLGFDFAGSVPELNRVEPDQLRHMGFRDLAQYFRRHAQRLTASGGAILLVLEDIHWSDQSSLELVQHIAKQCPDIPMMILALTRPTLAERKLGWAEGMPDHLQLALSPLSPRDSDLLVQRILHKVTEIPPSLRDLVLSGTEGNPFYIEEMIKMLIDQKVILPGREEWSIEPQRLVAAAIPATLTGVLQARLDGLDSAERSILQCASVVGQVFWDSAVERLSRATSDSGPLQGEGNLAASGQLLAALDGLCQKELIFRRESSAFAGSVEYAFKHELLRSVTYAGLLKKARRAYHEQVAAWLIDQSRGRIGEYTALVAGHFEKAGRAVEAADWYGRAGQQARGGYAPATASDHFQKALALLPAHTGAESVHAKQLEWYEGLTETLAAQARFVEALENCRTFQQLAEAAGDLAAQARAGNGLAFIHERRGQNRLSLEAGQKAEALARQAGLASRGELIRALHLQGWALYRLGDAEAVLRLADTTLQLCHDFGERRGIATCYKLHGVAHLQLGHFDAAENYFRQGLELCGSLGDRRTAGAMWSNLGETARLRGDCRAAVELYQKALNVAREIGHRESEVIYLSNLCGARLGLGQFQEAETELRQAIALIGSAQAATLSETYSFLSTACLGQGKLQEALDAAGRALAIAKESENNLDLGGAWLALGRALAAAHSARISGTSTPNLPESPAGCFAESLRIYEQINAGSEQARTLQAWAQYDLQQGSFEESRKKSAAAQAILSRLAANEKSNPFSL